MTTPSVSILLAVFKGATTLPRCLASIAEQTYRDFELIYIDDASPDQSLQVLTNWQAQHPHYQVTILRNPTNQGLTASLTRGLNVARGHYIARLDADDWWAPTKLAEQVAFLTAHPDHGLVGCHYFNVRADRKEPITLPVTDAAIRRRIYWRNPFGHSCVLIRQSVLKQVHGYDTALRFGQDRDLWFRLLPITKLANLPHFLCYRTVDATLSTTSTRQQMWQQIRTVHKYIQRYHASPLAYLSLLEPLAVMLLPHQVRQWLRIPYDYFFTH